MRVGLRALLGASLLAAAAETPDSAPGRLDLTAWLRARRDEARKFRRGSPAEQQRRQDTAIAKRQRKGARRQSERAGFANVATGGRR